MATKTVFLKYTIFLPNAEQVSALQHPSGAGPAVAIAPMSPEAAAVRYNAPIYLPNQDVHSPGITSPYINTSDHFPTDVYTFDRKSGGWFGLSFLFGDTTHYYWRGEFEFLPNTTDSTGTGPSPAAMKQRRWIQGFELNSGELATGSTSLNQITRMASRHTDGHGLALRAAVTGDSHTVSENRAGLTPASSWERFYLRVARAPSGTSHVWRCHGTTSPQEGLLLDVNASRQLALYQSDNIGTFTNLGTTVALDVNKWYRVDVLFTFGTGAMAKVYLNGALVLDISGISGGMATAGRTHATSEIGLNVGTFTGAIDVDDWICADMPGALTGLDWLNGSRVVPIMPTGMAASNAWTGDWRILLQNMNLVNALQTLSSSTSAQRLAVTTDAQKMVDEAKGSLGGAVAGIFAVYSTSAGLQGQVGYSIGGVDTLTATANPAESGTAADHRIAYLPVLGQTPPALTPLELVYLKAADTSAATVKALRGCVEIVGNFDQADNALAANATLTPGHVLEAPAASRGIHNAPYPESIWARQGTPPQSPVIVVSGTYAGTGSGIDLQFRAPVHFLYIRDTIGSVAGVWWLSSGLGAHQNQQMITSPGLVGRAEKDPTFSPGGVDTQQERYVVHIPGGHADVNQAAHTYNYIAFCDPGNRFLHCSALQDIAQVTTPDRTTPLVDTDFTPIAGIFLHEEFGTTTTVGAHYKGPGATATQLKPMTSGADLAGALQFVAGGVTVPANGNPFVDSGAKQVAMALWRLDDNSADAGIPRVVQAFSYTGDGNASRTVAFSRPSGRRPLFALVVPHTTAAPMLRDPSHTTTNSLQLPGSNNGTTGITAGGIDSITVGSTLNSNGVIYDVLIFPGDTTAGNNGWSGQGEFDPVEPTTPVGGSWTTPPAEPPAEDTGAVPSPTTPTVPPDTDFGAGCQAASTKICNVALTYVGNSLKLANIATDIGIEAELCRLHYVDALEETLRRYPWPFATAYATLVLTTGTSAAPVNRDWTYQYAAPADMLYARRLAADDGGQRSWGREPQRFRTVGTSIYADDTSAVLEYTRRPTCAASEGDALFRDALAWQLAGKLAPTLARDDKKAGACFSMFENVLQRAMVAAANEDQKDPQPGDADWITDRL